MIDVIVKKLTRGTFFTQLFHSILRHGGPKRAMGNNESELHEV